MEGQRQQRGRGQGRRYCSSNKPHETRLAGTLTPIPGERERERSHAVQRIVYATGGSARSERETRSRNCSHPLPTFFSIILYLAAFSPPSAQSAAFGSFYSKATTKSLDREKHHSLVQGGGGGGARRKMDGEFGEGEKSASDHQPRCRFW